MLQLRFHDVDGAVLALAPEQNKPHEALKRDPRPKCCFENEMNHQHFDFAVGETVFERWQNNLVLANLIRELWQSKLALQFPNRSLEMIIQNEIALAEDDTLYFEIVPCLRMWSRQNDLEEELAHTFGTGRHGEDKIALRNQAGFEFVPIGEVFSENGEVRLSFSKRVNKHSEAVAGRTYI